MLVISSYHWKGSQSNHHLTKSCLLAQSLQWGRTFLGSVLLWSLSFLFVCLFLISAILCKSHTTSPLGGRNRFISEEAATAQQAVAQNKRGTFCPRIFFLFLFLHLQKEISFNPFHCQWSFRFVWLFLTISLSSSAATLIAVWTFPLHLLLHYFIFLLCSPEIYCALSNGNKIRFPPLYFSFFFAAASKFNSDCKPPACVLL